MACVLDPTRQPAQAGVDVLRPANSSLQHHRNSSFAMSKSNSSTPPWSLTLLDRCFTRSTSSPLPPIMPPQGFSRASCGSRLALSRPELNAVKKTDPSRLTRSYPFLEKWWHMLDDPILLIHNARPAPPPPPHHNCLTPPHSLIFC